jgi:hypothetical protein
MVSLSAFERAAAALIPFAIFLFCYAEETKPFGVSVRAFERLVYTVTQGGHTFTTGLGRQRVGLHDKGDDSRLTQCGLQQLISKS